MSERYKVRMTILAMVKARDGHEATQAALDLIEDVGLVVLNVEEPEAVAAPLPYRDQEDIYP